MPAITPASVPSRIEATSGTSRWRARSRNCSACSVGVLASISIVSTPVARYQNGDSSWSVSAWASSAAARRRATQYGAQACTLSAPGSRGRRVVAAPPTAPTATTASDDDGEDATADEQRPPAGLDRASAGRRGAGQRGRRRRRRDVAAEVADLDVLEAGHDDPPGAGAMVDDVGHGDDDATGGRRRLDAGRRVLDGDALHGVDAQRGGGQEVRLGVRLAVLDVVAGDDGLERDRLQRLDDGVDEPAPRHRDERARDALGVELGQQPPGARAATARARGPGR